MPLSERHDPVETLAANRQHEPLRERIEVRAPCGKPHHLGAPSRECRPKLPRVQRIAVHEEISLPSQKAVHCVEEVARHLVHPQRVWLTADPGDGDLPVCEIDDEKTCI